MGIKDHLLHRFICALIAGMAAVQSSAPVATASPNLEELAKRVGVRILANATSDREVLRYTKSRLPFNKMSVGARQRASAILNDLSQYRRMPSLQYPVDRGMYQYLVNHPDVGVSTWRVMGISKLQMWQTGEFEYEASAADGSEGLADVLWRDGNQCLFIVEGRYNSPLLPNPISASALVWLQYRFVQSKSGQYLVNQQVETFIHFPSTAIDAIARIASRVTNTILDRNVFEVSLYARMMSQAVEKDPEWMMHLAERMDGVLPARRSELKLIAERRIPANGKPLPVVAGQKIGEQDRIRASGQFQTFESSLHQLNVHVPLVPSEVRHQPSYGQKIGDAHPLMSKPHAFLTPEAKKAIADNESKRRAAIEYSLSLAAQDAAKQKSVAVSAVPPVKERAAPRSSLGKLMDSPTPLFFSATEPDTHGAGKASSVLNSDKSRAKRLPSVPRSNSGARKAKVVDAEKTADDKKAATKAKSVSSSKTVEATMPTEPPSVPAAEAR